MSPTLPVVSRTRPEGLLKVALSLTRLWPDDDDYVCVCACVDAAVSGAVVCLKKYIYGTAHRSIVAIVAIKVHP